MLVIALEEVIDAFWNQYIDMLPAEGKQAFLEAKEDESGQKLIDWNYDYANFPEDDEAEKRGAKVLTDIAERLPEMLKSMYDDVEAATQSTTA